MSIAHYKIQKYNNQVLHLYKIIEMKDTLQILIISKLERY